MTFQLRLYITSLSFLLIVAGCSTHQNTTTQNPSTAGSSLIESEMTNVEDEICLNAELQKLQEAGNWSIQKNQSINKAETNVTYDFPIILTPQVEMYLELIQTKQRRQFARWLEKSGKYLPMMLAELEKAGLPRDLAYLAMIESGYSQTAYSRAKAVGLWQFMKGTGKHCGLTINSYVDERRDALKSTKAAAVYLSELYNQFNDWHLAVAAYNAGPGKVRYGLKKYNVDNFWALADKKYLRLETKRYVPKLIATIMIAKDPEKYGFTSLSYHPPIQYDTIRVGPGLPLDAVAAIAETDPKEIKMLNLELKKGRIPNNVAEYSVNVPYGKKQLAEANLPRLHSMVTTGYKTHIVRKGESVQAISKRYNINTTTLAKVNKLKGTSLPNGKRLKIPYSTVTYQLLPEGDSEKLIAYKNSLILHKIKNGETISKIAKKYRVPSDLIVSWNGLKSVHKIRAGQQLALYINRTDISQTKKGNSTQKYIRATPKNKTANIDRISNTAGVTKKIINSSAKNKTFLITNEKTAIQAVETVTSVWYHVQDGDSLWTIARKFKTSPKTLRQLNNLQSNLIHPGNKLKVAKG